MRTSWRNFRLALRIVPALCGDFFSDLAKLRNIRTKELACLIHSNPVKMLGSMNLKNLALRDQNSGALSFSDKNTITVAVEGNIGSGKTTLLEYFKTSSVVEALREPIEQWTNIKGHNALQMLYEDPKRWSFSFNMYAQLTRAQMHTSKCTKPVKMLERSLHSTRLCFVENDFRNQTINGMEYGILTSWYDWLVKSQKATVDLIVYVRADPEVCFERIKKRSRKEEALVPFSLIQNLHNLHEEWLIDQTLAKPPASVVVLDANRDYSEMKQLYETRRQEILCGYM